MRILKRSLWILLVAALLAACTNSREEVTGGIPIPPPDNTEASQGQPQQSGQDVPSQESESLSPGQALEPATDEQVESMPGLVEEIVVEAADGLQLAGTFYPPDGSEPAPGVLLLHMNGRNRFDWEDFARLLVESGYAVLTTDMRGHGETGDRRDWVKAEDDLLRVYEYFTGRKEVDADRTAIAGASIGANMALVIGDDQPEIPGLVLLSPGRDYMGVTTEDRILGYGERPLLIVASEEDTESAITARSLADLALGEVTLEMYAGAGHGTNMFGSRPELSELIIDWLDRHVAGIDRAENLSQASPLPAPSLFETNWDDRSPYLAGLIPSESGILTQLPGAPVYHMDLALSPDLFTLAGRLETLYTNQENVELGEVYFHLYPNLLGGRINISALTVNGQRQEPRYELNQTVLRVPLDSPLPPGDQVVVALEFLVDIPTEGGSNYGVFATIDNVVALAHFFPQFAVYDDQGWNIEIPPPNADVTYADASFYLMRLVTPQDQVPVVSGVLLDRQVSGENQVSTYAAGPVRDFYLASSADYVLSSAQVGQTTINNYGFPEFEEHNQLALLYAAGAMESFNSRFGPYPYTEFDIAPTPNQALAVEYPGVVVIRSALYNPLASIGDTPATVYLEGSVAHEVGHQWFYNMVGSDQINEPWLDESLTQHITYLYFVDAYGEENAEPFHDSFYGRWERVDYAEIPIGLPAGDYSGAEYSAIVYGRGPLFFDALKEEMGEAAFDAFLRDYSQQYRWDIAYGPGLKALAEEHCGCDLTPLFDEWVGEL